MKLELKNIGPFKNAEVEFGDVTVIAGVNNTGKSYLNKLIFSISKVYSNNIKNELLSSFFDSFNIIFQDIKRISNYFLHSRNSLKYEKTVFEDLKNQLDEIIKEKTYFYESWVDKFSKNGYNFEDFWYQISKDYNNHLGANLKFLNKIEGRLKDSVDKDPYILSEINYTKGRILKQKEEIEKILNSNLEKLFSLIISNIFLENFDNESIKNKKFLSEESKLLFSTENNFLNLFLKSENEFELKDNFLDLIYFDPIFSDVTYIDDTAEILGRMITAESSSNHSFRKFILVENNAKSVFRLRNFNFRNDLQLKMDNLFSTKENNDLNNIVDIQTLNNKFQEYFDLRSSLNLRKSTLSENDIDIHLENSSKGLKIIKVFQELINNDFFKKDTMVIIDEPESFLHPNWQSLFIKLLLDIAEVKKIKIVLSTHSPYIIETIDSLSQRDFKKLKFKYNYLSKSETDQSIIIESTNDPNNINEELSYPYRKLEDYEFDWDRNNRKN